MNSIYLGSTLIIFSVLKMLGVSFHFIFFQDIYCCRLYYIILDRYRILLVYRTKQKRV